MDQERSKWLSLFPTELWLQILDKVEDPDTFYNLARSSTWMAVILHPRRVEYLFAPVLRILEQQKYCHSEIRSELLVCRLVSSSWKKGVDNILQIRPYHSENIIQSPCIRCMNCTIANDNGDTDPAHEALFQLYTFPITQIESELLPAMDSLHYRTNSPSPSRHLNILEGQVTERYLIQYGEETATFKRYREATESFLEKVGHHFWHLRIGIDGFTSKIGYLEWYMLIRKYALLVPNLKSLYLQTTWPKLETEEFANLDRLINRFPFPALPNLSLVSAQECPRSLMKAIVTANKDLKLIHFSPPNANRCAVDKKCAIRGLQNPEMVSTSICSVSELCGLPDKWKLTVLRISFHGKSFLEWGHVFIKLESYQDTLQQVYLDGLPVARSTSEKESIWKQSKVMLNLPNVKTFSIKVGQICSLDFLLGLKSLERLTVQSSHAYESPPPSWFDPTTEVINSFGKYGNDFCECNIWDLIPSLQSVSLTIMSERKVEYKRNGSRIECDYWQPDPDYDNLW